MINVVLEIYSVYIYIYTPKGGYDILLVTYNNTN